MSNIYNATTANDCFENNELQFDDFGMIQPKINYITININKYNVKMYRNTLPVLPLGFCRDIDQGIHIFRYQISKSFHLSDTDILYKNIQKIKMKEKATVLHETKHWFNLFVGDITNIANNVYEFVVLNAINEVSAFSAEYFDNKIPCEQNVLDAMLCGIEQYEHRIIDYLYSHIKRVQNQAFICDMINKTLYKHGYNFDTDRYKGVSIYFPQKAKYSKQFYQTVNRYLTFGQHSLLTINHNDKKYKQVRQKLYKIKHVYEQQLTDKVINKIYM